MKDNKTDHKDVLLLLKSNPELKRLVHTFFLRKMARLKLKVIEFKPANQAFHRIIWSKRNSVEGLKYNHIFDALKEIKETESSLIQYIQNNLEKLPTEYDFTCSVSSYLKTLYSCDRWFYEMISSFPEDDSFAEARYEKSKFLEGWAQSLQDIVISNIFSTDQSLGGSCLCIYNTDDGYEYLLGQKSSLANAFNELHVLPSFMFQPNGKNPLKYAKELSVKTKVFQELAEEVFYYDEILLSGDGGRLCAPGAAAIINGMRVFRSLDLT